MSRACRLEEKRFYESFQKETKRSLLRERAIHLNRCPQAKLARVSQDVLEHGRDLSFMVEDRRRSVGIIGGEPDREIIFPLYLLTAADTSTADASVGSVLLGTVVLKL